MKWVDYLSASGSVLIKTTLQTSRLRLQQFIELPMLSIDQFPGVSFFNYLAIAEHYDLIKVQ